MLLSAFLIFSYFLHFHGTYALQCNSSLLFDVLLRDFWLLQFGHSFLGGQLPDTEESYALAVASCKVYSTQFEKHRFLLQACFQQGDYKATSLQHRMAGLCNPKVIESIKPNLSCLKSIYSSRSYDVCMASALQQLANYTQKIHQTPLRYNDAPYHCINIRQSILCSQYAMHLYCDGNDLNSVQYMFDSVWANNAVVEGHYECPLRAVVPYERKRIGEEKDRRRLNAFCKNNAKSTTDPLLKAISSYPDQLIRELLTDDRSTILSNITNRLSSYVQCSRVALFGTNLGGKGTSFSPMNDWMIVLETFLDLSKDIRKLSIINSTCISAILSINKTPCVQCDKLSLDNKRCFQCADKLSPSYALSDYRFNRLSFSSYIEAIINDNDALSFCRATLSLIRYLLCLIRSVQNTCDVRLGAIENRIEEMRNETETIYGCPKFNAWYSDLEFTVAYEEQKRNSSAVVGNVSALCDA